MERSVKLAHSRTRVQTETPKDAKTKCVQSEKNNADINNIVARAFKSGQLPILNRQPLPELPDHQTYQEMMNKVVFAQQSFERLPAEVRVLFANDPAKMLECLADKKRKTEHTEIFQQHGILETPPPAPVEPPPAPKDEPAGA